ncbi:hypothetical protein NQ317_008939 [Molorchus minor]|uniref:J domain-containing protein n=1 Tax=Molorchus minor TaxID=1323400 RepID=A0ABQ9K2J6_9CUCU|nr:hypothetical protein NQ317_008939 [Molorchus minor]
MRWAPQLWLCQSYVLIYLLWSVLGELDNPYTILRVHRKASQQEIRKAYKQLAKEWHPDKSDHPDAERRFVDIKQAYELLSDPDRRKRQYDKIIVPKSEKIPYLIFFYTDWCFQCLQSAPYCRKIVDYLGPLGINFATVHSGREPNLSRRLSIHTLPCLVLVLDGNIYVYKETITSITKIIEFIRAKMPYKMVAKVKENDIDSFLSGWEDNRVRSLIFEPKQSVRLRYLVTAYYFRHRVAFGYVNSQEIRDMYQVPNDMDTVLLFNENTSYPMAFIRMKDISTTTLHDVISSNQYLTLPRLSSQEILEALCPCEWNKPRKKLCVVLVTEASHSYDPHRQSFRSYAQSSPYGTERVRFAYIYHDKQAEFVNSLIPEGKLVEPLLKIVILWRKDTSHIKYEWVDAKWEVETDLNETTQLLESKISTLLKSSEALAYETFVKDLFDEHAKGTFSKIITKIMNFAESCYDGMNKDQILPALSVLGTMIFILALGYFMSYLVRLEEENIQKQKAKAKSGNNNNDTTKIDYQPELHLHELRSETYNALVRLLKPGCRTIVLVLDMQSRQQLIPSFHKAVWPYRKNKTLMFSYMYIERGLNWYKELLQMSLPEERELNINPRNCVGTVLSLNGHRKYFCVFHVKHTEKKKKEPKDLRNSGKKTVRVEPL